MTEEEGLLKLVLRAIDRNLYFKLDSYGPRVETIEGEEEDLLGFKSLFGGMITYNARSRFNPHARVWLIRNDEALTLIKKLLERPDFRRSGKYEFASEVLYEVRRRA